MGGDLINIYVLIAISIIGIAYFGYAFLRTKHFSNLCLAIAIPLILVEPLTSSNTIVLVFGGIQVVLIIAAIVFIILEMRSDKREKQPVSEKAGGAQASLDEELIQIDAPAVDDIQYEEDDPYEYTGEYEDVPEE